MLFTSTCSVCGRAGPDPCAACVGRLRPAPLLPAPPGVDGCVALFAYEGAGRDLVARLKYRNHRAALGRLAAGLAALVDPATVDVVTWAPTTRTRRHRRGFDQAELLARAVARHLRRPCRPLLRRVPGPAQTGRARHERLDTPRFAVRRWAAVPARILVVDDVVTTGATAAAAAGTLRHAATTTTTATTTAATTTTVRVACLARTPLKVANRAADTLGDGTHERSAPPSPQR